MSLMPLSIAKYESYAIVTATTKLDLQNPDKIAPENQAGLGGKGRSRLPAAIRSAWP